jgi:hypothetical protein
MYKKHSLKFKNMNLADFEKISFVINTKNIRQVWQEFIIIITIVIMLNSFLNYFIYNPKISQKLKINLNNFKQFCNNFILINILVYNFVILFKEKLPKNLNNLILKSKLFQLLR